MRFDIQPGREGFVDFKSGQESMVYRAKNGHLMVVSVEFIKGSRSHNVKWLFVQRFWPSSSLSSRNLQEPSPDDVAVTAVFVSVILLHGCCQLCQMIFFLLFCIYTTILFNYMYSNIMQAMPIFRTRSDVALKSILSGQVWRHPRRIEDALRSDHSLKIHRSSGPHGTTLF